MLRDLSGSGPVAQTADCVVIGSGTLGLPTACLLAEAGFRVVCLESGGEHQQGETHPFNEAVHAGSHYDGADAGRARCLGGTSTRWGGALLPFQQADLSQAEWPIAMADLDPYLLQVEALFGLEPGPYSDPALALDLGPNHVNRLAKWPSFKRRNVANLLGERIRQLPNLSVWLNASVTRIAPASDGGPVTIEARSLGGDVLTVHATRAIIAAGAIETTRLALLLDRTSGGAVSRASPSVGRYFADHLSSAVADIDPLDRAALNRIVGFRFGPGGGMRNLRLELAPDAPARASLPPCFAHVGFETARPGGFEALREILRHVQLGKAPPARELARLAGDLPWLTRAAWWRFARQRMLFPADSRLRVHIVMEQAPEWNNHIALSESRVDAFGLPLAEIAWLVTPGDISKLAAHADLLEQTWTGSGLARLGTWQRARREEVAAELGASGGVFHPTGSTRMAHHAADGVVDRDLRMFAFPQVQLLSTSVLPTGGGANPTMMGLLLALRCVAQHIAAKAA